MKKQKALWILALFIVIFTFINAVEGALTDGLVAFYPVTALSTTVLTDVHGGFTGNFSNSAMPTNTGCLIGDCSDFTGANNRMIDIPNLQSRFSSSSNFTLNMWVKINGGEQYDTYYTFKSGGTQIQGYREITGHIFSNSTTANNFYTAFTNNTWVMFTFMSNSTHNMIYINGVLSNSSAVTWNKNTFTDAGDIGNNNQAQTRAINGYTDEMGIWNRTLTATELTLLYNNGAGEEYPFNDNFTLTLTNAFNGSSIQNFSAIFNGEIYSTTSGIISTNVNKNASAFGNISFFNISDAGGFFNVSYTNVNLSSNFQGNTSQANVTFLAYQKITNTSIVGNITNGTYNYGLTNVTLPWNAGTFNVTFYNSTTYNKTQQFTVSALTTNIINITNIHNATLNISAYNTSGSLINTFDGWINYGTFNETFSSTTGSVIVNLTGGFNYTVYAKSNAHAISNTTNYQTININAASKFLNFTFYPYNSIYLTIKDETTGSNILSNCTVALSGPTSETRSINATYTYANLTTGTYTLTISNPNYETRSYSVTVAAGSTQTLTAYLSNSSSYVGIIVLDSYDDSVIENATVSLYAYVNATYSLLEVKNTDITGRAQFNYVSSTSYTFVVQKTNYITKSFTLNPISYTSYDVPLDRSIAYVYTGSQEDVKITYSPSNYWANQSTNFSIIFSSATGVLNSYGANVTWRCGNFNLSGNNSIGGTLSNTFTINCSSYRDTINITYYYTSVGNSEKTYYARYYISGSSSASNYTWVNMRNNHYGMGLLERITIVTILALIVTGMSYLMVGSIASLALGLFVFGYFLATGFVPFWSVIISLCAGVLIILGGKD